MQLLKLQKPDQGRSLFLHKAALAQHTEQCSGASFCNITVLWVVNTDCMVKITISVSLCANASAVFVTAMHRSQKVEVLISTNKWKSLVSDSNVFWCRKSFQGRGVARIIRCCRMIQKYFLLSTLNFLRDQFTRFFLLIHYCLHIS